MSETGDIIWAGNRAWQKWDTGIWCHLWGHDNAPAMATKTDLKTLPDFRWVVKDGKLVLPTPSPNEHEQTITVIEVNTQNGTTGTVEPEPNTILTTEPQKLGSVVVVAEQEWVKVSMTETLSWCRLIDDEHYDPLTMFTEYYYPFHDDIVEKKPALTSWATLTKMGDIKTK